MKELATQMFLLLHEWHQVGQLSALLPKGETNQGHPLPGHATAKKIGGVLFH